MQAKISGSPTVITCIWVTILTDLLREHMHLFLRLIVH